MTEQQLLQKSREALFRMKDQLEFFKPWSDIYAIIIARYSELVFKQIALEKAIDMPEVISRGFGFPWIITGIIAGASWAVSKGISSFFQHRTEVNKAEKNNQLAEEIIRQGGSPSDVIGMLKGDTFPIKISSLLGWGLLALGGVLIIREAKKLAD